MNECLYIHDGVLEMDHVLDFNSKYFIIKDKDSMFLEYGEIESQGYDEIKLRGDLRIQLRYPGTPLRKIYIKLSKPSHRLYLCVSLEAVAKELNKTMDNAKKREKQLVSLIKRKQNILNKFIINQDETSAVVDTIIKEHPECFI